MTLETRIRELIREADDARAEVKRLSDELVSERENCRRLVDECADALAERDRWRRRAEARMAA